MKRCCRQARWLLVFLPMIMSAGVLWAVDTPTPEQSGNTHVSQDSVFVKPLQAQGK